MTPPDHTFTGVGAAFYPEHHPRELWPKYVELMPGAGLSFVRMLEFAWDKLEPREGRYDFEWLDEVMDLLAAKGVSVLMCTPTATPPLWAYETYPEIGIVDAQGRYRGFDLRRHTCPTSPSYRRLCDEIVAGLARRYGKDSRVIGWQIDNEIGHADCFCDQCLKRFRQWCHERFGTIDSFNESIVTAFWAKTIPSFDHIPWPIGHDHPSLWLLYRRFYSDMIVECFGAQADLLRQCGAAAPITTNMMGTWYGYDHEKLAAKLDVIAADHYAFGNAFGQDLAGEAFLSAYYRGLKPGAPLWFNEFQCGKAGHGVLPLPGQMRMWLLQQVGLGASQVSFFRWDYPRSGAERNRYALVHPSLETGRMYEELGRAVEELNELKPLLDGTEPVKAEAALLFSWANHCEFTIEAKHPAFEGRFGNGYSDHIAKHFRALATRNVPVDVVYPGDDFSRYRVIMAPALFVLTEELAGKLTRFVEGGGTLVTTSFTGIVDENGRMWDLPAPGPLAGTCGIRIVDNSAYHDKMGPLFIEAEDGFAIPQYQVTQFVDEIMLDDDVDVMARFEGLVHSGTPAVTRARRGKGQAWYLGTLLEEHDLTSFYAELLDRLDIRPIFPAVEHLGASLREKDGLQLLFVSNTDIHPHEVTLPEGWVDAITDTPADTVTVAPFDVLVLRQSTAESR